MVTELLVTSAIEGAARLLSELDRIHFPVESMFWVQMPEGGHWRLVPGSPLAASDPLDTYLRLRKVLRDIDVGLELTNVSVVKPDSSELIRLLSAVESSGRFIAGQSWLTFGEGVVFRWNSEAIAGELSCDASAFELAQIWTAERKQTNQPPLLFDGEGRLFTARFHPEHGRLGGLENLTQPLQIALRGSRPDCRITWN